MFLKSIKLTNFRNYNHCEFEFKKPITVFLGDNAQGKTNFLEAVYFLATTKSFKAEREEELILEEQDFLRVEGKVSSAKLEGSSGLLKTEHLMDEELIDLEIAVQKTEDFLKKKIKVNGIPRRIIDYSGNLVVVEFLPEDINLVSGSPSLRRNHIDSFLAQVDKGYKKALSNYEQVLTNKNRVLKNIREGFAKKDQLIFWVDKQLEFGKVIVEKRKAFFYFLNSAEKKFGKFSFEYIENILSEERLIEYQQREIESASSLIGPHRDDFIFCLETDGISKKKNLSKYGSRGEQRTSVLDLKITEVEFVEDSLNSRPVLLLDDIFSELDLNHQRHVIDLSKMQQTIITGVEFNSQLKKEVTNANFFSVENAQISGIADKL